MPTPLHRTRIKVCGVRRPRDARDAAALGADAIGVICYPPAGRHVPTETAAAIVRALPPFVGAVALFVDQPVADVNAVAAAIGASAVQLHGHETPDYAAGVALPVLKAVRADRATFEVELDVWRSAVAGGRVTNLRGLVLETPGSTGGTGQANDWDFVLAVQARGGFEGLPPIVAAGGLTPANVGEVVRRVRPYAVDVSSGVERVRGEKSADLIEAFVANVRRGEGVNDSRSDVVNPGCRFSVSPKGWASDDAV